VLAPIQFHLILDRWSQSRLLVVVLEEIMAKLLAVVALMLNLQMLLD
jgi:hypothetical protein